VLKTGIPWEYLPQEMGCGSGMTCWRRLRDWQKAGVWDKIHQILLNKLRQADVFSQLGFITEPLWVEDFCGKLCGDGLADAGMRSEKFDRCADWFFTECLFDFLLCELDLVGDEAKFFDEYIEAISKRFRQADAFKFFDGRAGPVQKSLRLVDSVLKKKAFYLKFDSSLFPCEMLAKAGELTLGLWCLVGIAMCLRKPLAAYSASLRASGESVFESGADCLGVFEGATTLTGISAC